MAGNRVVIFKKVARIGLIAKVILSEMKTVTNWVTWGCMFHAGGRII